MRISLLFFVITIILTINANAFLDSGQNFKWWKNSRVASQLDLSDEQVRTIDAIFASYKDSFVKYRKALRSQEVQLKKELQNPEAKREDVLTLIDSIENTKAAYTRTKVEMYLKVKDVLTPQQQATLHQIKIRYRRYHK